MSTNPENINNANAEPASNILNFAATESGMEKQVSLRLIQTLRGKDYIQFLHTIKSVSDNPHLLIAAMNLVAQEVNCAELTIPAAPLLSYQAKGGKTKETTVIVFRVNIARRILVIAPPDQVAIYGADESRESRESRTNAPLSTLLFENPELLFQRIGTIASMPRIPVPPPMHQPVR